MVNSESAMTEIILNMCVFNEGRSLQRLKTAAKRYSDFYREREALAISVDSVREIWPGSYPVDFVQCKYRSEEMFYGS